MELLMKRNINEYHPDRIVDSHLGEHLPSQWRDVMRFAVIALAWYGVISSMISLVSSLAWVIDAAHWIYSQAGVLKPLIAKIGSLIRIFVAIWRAVTQPVYHLLFGWLPIKVPREVLDVLVISWIFGAGYFRAWFATREERRLMGIFGDVAHRQLTLEGRVALVKRMLACLDVLMQDNPENLKDKAEAELVNTLDEMASGDASDESFRVIEEALFLNRDDVHGFLMRCAYAASEAALIRSEILGRSIVIGVILSTCLVVDFTYVYWKQ
jgi:hypothetical protein